MALERADRLKSPPLLGKYYLVPALLWDWDFRGGTEMWWPVLGYQHNDVQFFGIHEMHYHVDPRFLTRRHWRCIWASSIYSKLNVVISKPLGLRSRPDGVREKPEPTRMRCSMVEVPYGHAHQMSVCSLNRHFDGTQCAKGKRGFVCPHKHIALGSIAPIDGVITCPLHGLRVDAETGICLGPITQLRTVAA